MRRVIEKELFGFLKFFFFCDKHVDTGLISFKLLPRAEAASCI